MVGILPVFLLITGTGIMVGYNSLMLCRYSMKGIGSILSAVTKDGNVDLNQGLIPDGTATGTTTVSSALFEDTPESAQAQMRQVKRRDSLKGDSSVDAIRRNTTVSPRIPSALCYPFATRPRGCEALFPAELRGIDGSSSYGYALERYPFPCVLPGTRVEGCARDPRLLPVPRLFSSDEAGAGQDQRQHRG